MVLSIFTVEAYAASNEGLKAAFNELNYSLTVEWNQKDKDFYTAQMKKFSSAVRDLQAKGLTNQQLIDFISSEVKDQKVAKDMQTALTMISLNRMTSSEAAQYMSEMMKKSYSKGASWSGDAGLVIVAVVVVAVIVAVAVAGGRGGNGGYYGGGACYDYYTCDTFCYDDYYWGYTCSDDCYYTCY